MRTVLGLKVKNLNVFDQFILGSKQFFDDSIDFFDR